MCADPEKGELIISIQQNNCSSCHKRINVGIEVDVKENLLISRAHLRTLSRDPRPIIVPKANQGKSTLRGEAPGPNN